MKTTQIFTAVLTASLLFTSSAFANDDLKAIMKKMGSDAKALAGQINTPSANASSIQLAQDIQAQLKLALNQVPDEIANLSPDAQPAATSDYQNQINQTIAVVAQLIADLQANNNAAAVNDFSNMNSDKKAGHEKFNPQD